MELTKRLKTLASLVNEGMTVADIGTDHGYIPIYLIKEKLSPKVIAMDINKDPLEKAENNGRAYCVNDSIEYRLSNGLEKLNSNEVDCVLIAGMGGKLIEQILNNDKNKLKSYKKLILSPHRDIECLRIFLNRQGLNISKELMLVEEGHYYNIIVVSPNESESLKTNEKEENLINIYNKYGKLLIDEKNPILKEQLEKSLITMNKLLKDLEEKGITKRIREVRDDIEERKRVIEWLN